MSKGISCPHCSHDESTVKDSRVDVKNVRRRRLECNSCGQRFTTFETFEPTADRSRRINLIESLVIMEKNVQVLLRKLRSQDFV